VYLSDTYVRSDRYGLGGTLFRGVIQRFVRGRMHVHFEDVAQATRVLQGAGFGAVALHAPQDLPATRELGAIRGGNRVRILEALAAAG
jgi:hypothetical protein